jgi:GNAT acetyltransferase
VRSWSNAIDAAISRARSATRARGSPDPAAAHASAVRSSASTVTRSPLPGIETIPTHAFLTHCSTHQITPHWDCWADNTPSIAVAEKTGFGTIETYSILVVSPDIQWPARYGGFIIDR